MNNEYMNIDNAIIEIPVDKKRDFIRVKSSNIQGMGVFAKKKIPKGTRIIEYKGYRTNLRDLKKDIKSGITIETYCLQSSAGFIIDGYRNGNDARFINHSCNPNCETYTFDNSIFIYADRDIKRGEELTFNYNLGLLSKRKKSSDLSDIKYKCNCGSENCKGTMIA